MTHLSLKRYAFGEDSTLGLLFVKGQFECFTLEDEIREEKEYGETAIWEGTYEVGLNTTGGMNADYAERFGEDFHKGMLEIKDIPEFTHVYFHILNTESQTYGCPGVGDSVLSNKNGKGYLGNSETAYKRFYPKVRDELLNGERVLLHVEKVRI